MMILQEEIEKEMIPTRSDIRSSTPSVKSIQRWEIMSLVSTLGRPTVRLFRGTRSVQNCSQFHSGRLPSITFKSIRITIEIFLFRSGGHCRITSTQYPRSGISKIKLHLTRLFGYTIATVTALGFMQQRYDFWY